MRCEVLGLGNFSSHFLCCCIEAVFWKARAKGFTIRDQLCAVGVDLNIPSFVTGGKQIYCIREKLLQLGST